MSIQIQFRRGNSTDWIVANPILAEGEVGVELDTLFLKVGNGVDVWVDLPYFGTTGLVSSVGMTVPTGLEVTGSPITTSGTLAVTFQTGYSIPTTSNQTNWNTAYSWGNHATAGYLDNADIGVSVQAYNINTVIDASYVHTDNNYTSTEKTKLSGIEDGADVTDAANVSLAGAVMDGDFTSNGLMKRTGAGTYAVITDNSSNWDTAYSWGNHASAGYLLPTDIGVSIQGYDSNLSAIASLSGTSGLLKKTAINTWTLDTSTYLTTETDPVYTASSWYSTTNNSSNWNTAYSDRLKWDGGSSGLVASTGRTSLGATTIGANLFTLTDPSSVSFPRFNADNTISALSASDFRTAIGVSAGGGTVTSVDLSVPTGFSVSGNPVTTSGTIALAFASGYSLPTNTSQTNWNTAYSERNQWDGGSTGLVAATGRTSLGVTATGSDTTYAYRSNNLSDLTSVSSARTNLGLGTMATADTSSYSTTGTDTTYAYRSNNLSDLTNTSTARTNLGLGTAATMTGPSGTIVGTTDTQTLTNKRIDPRVSSTTSTASVTPDVSAYDIYAFTAQAATLTINAPIGTPVNGDKLIFRILDNGSSQTLSWNATFTAIGVTIPTATTASKMTYVGCIYNATNTRWDVIAVTTQA